jgi:hypothetical protein
MKSLSSFLWVHLKKRQIFVFVFLLFVSLSSCFQKRGQISTSKDEFKTKNPVALKKLKKNTAHNKEMSLKSNDKTTIVTEVTLAADSNKNMLSPNTSDVVISFDHDVVILDSTEFLKVAVDDEIVLDSTGMDALK